MASLQTGSRLRLVSRGSVWALREALEGRDCRISLEIQVWPQAKQLGEGRPSGNCTYSVFFLWEESGW